MDTLGQIKKILMDEILQDGVSLSPDTPLLNGLLDSFSVMQLVTTLEETFDIEIDEGEITVDTFGTLLGIERLVDRASGKEGLDARPQP